MFTSIITAVVIPTAKKPVRKIAYAITLEDNSSNLLHFNAATISATRRVRTITGLLAAIHDGLLHLPSGTEKVILQVASPRIRETQASAARDLVRRSSVGPKGSSHQNKWREIKHLLAGRITVWKHVHLNSTDQLSAMERSCQHLLETSTRISAESAQQSPAAERAIAIQRPLSHRTEIVAAVPIILRNVRACAELGFDHVA